MERVTVTGMAQRPKKAVKGHYYIDQWLDALDLDYAEVGTRLDVSRTTVWRWSKEQHRLDPLKTRNLCKAMGISEADLLRMPPKNPARPSLDRLAEHMTDDDFDDVLKHATKLSQRTPQH